MSVIITFLKASSNLDTPGVGTARIASTNDGAADNTFPNKPMDTLAALKTSATGVAKPLACTKVCEFVLITASRCIQF